MDSQTTRARAQAFIDALHALEESAPSMDGGNALDNLLALFADDARLTNAALRFLHEDRIGHDAIREFWLQYKRTIGQSATNFHYVTASEEAAGLFWTTTGTVDGTSSGIKYDGATLLAFNRDGLIRFFQGYYDTHLLNRQLGVEQE